MRAIFLILIESTFLKFHYYKKSRLTVIFIYLCDHLPIITPDNRDSTVFIKKKRYLFKFIEKALPHPEFFNFCRGGFRAGIRGRQELAGIEY